MRLHRIALACVAVACLTACAGVQDVVVHIPPHVPSAGPSALSGIPPTVVDLRTFQQPTGTGVLPGRIGERKTIGDVSMGLVTAAPAPDQVVTDAIKAELVAAGHHVTTGAAVMLDGEIERFDLHTNVTVLYWDVVGTVIVKLAAHGTRQSAIGVYDAVCSERTYLWPGGELIAHVLSLCVDDIARQFRNDAAVARALGG